MLGSNFVAQIVLEPSDSICAAKALFNPWMIETMKTTVITPTLTPRIVSADRSLLLRTVSNAIKADSRMSIKVISLIGSRASLPHERVSAKKPDHATIELELFLF